MSVACSEAMQESCRVTSSSMNGRWCVLNLIHPGLLRRVCVRGQPKSTVLRKLFVACCERESVCVCVCVCVRERERERERVADNILRV